MILPCIGGNVPGSSCWQDQQGVYYQKAYPLYADCHYHSNQYCKNAFCHHWIHATASGKGRVYAKNQQLIIDNRPYRQHYYKHQQKIAKILRGDAQDVSYKIAGKLVKATAIGHKHKTKGNAY